MHKRFGLSAFAVLGLLATAAAQADVQPGFYVGAGIGNTKIEVESDEFGIDFDADDTGFKIFGGYTFTDWFAVEAAYFDGGAPSENVFGADLEMEVSGFNVSAVGRLAMGEMFALFGKIGFASSDLEATA